MLKSVAAAKKINWYDKYIIDANNKPKQYFDVFILILVGYSCVTSMLSIAFLHDPPLWFVITSWTVDGIFLLDLLLNFIHARKSE